MDLDKITDLINRTFSNKLLPSEPKSTYEFSRFVSPCGVLVVFKSGKVLLQHKGLDDVEEFLISINSYGNYSIMIGADEVGKGELFGGILVCGVRILSDTYKKLERLASGMDTKRNAHLDRLEKFVSEIKSLGVEYALDEIPVEKLEPRSMNKLLTLSYVKVIKEVVDNVSPDTSKGSTRIVIDDFGMSRNDRNSVLASFSFADVVIEPKADDNYLECKVASLISRYYREKFLEYINSKYVVDGIKPGSGNLSDTNTIKWIRKWYESYGSIPPFVRRWKIIDNIQKSS
ncbi:MAG: hypothetical protein RMJ37_04985 [Spirochaetia bacterium]|nr:hypothetical protein [Spirochaetota bacterium]MCX8096518.1 hypothetical protein [Spirochaetota bacterium]MDW8112676.1 hypothetical protein [Spirochaetia bacterium]